MIRRAHPALRELTETLGDPARAEQGHPRLHPRRRHGERGGRAVQGGRGALGATRPRTPRRSRPRRSEQLGRYWNRLPDFLAELEPTMAELESTADEPDPDAAQASAAPPPSWSASCARPSRSRARPAASIGPLGETAERGQRRPSTSRKQEIAELRRLAPLRAAAGQAAAPVPAGDRRPPPLDRQRPAAAEPTAPPAPDKTAYKTGQGFTGMEAFWNYVYFQTLGINAFDELGHLLRIVLITGRPLRRPTPPSPTAAEIKECNSWLGPYQPGVTAPDPSRQERRGARRPRRGSGPTRSEVARAGAAASPRPRARSRASATSPSRRSRCPTRCSSCSDARQGCRRTLRLHARRRPAATPATDLLDYLLGAMRRRDSTSALVASPVLVGAVTVLDRDHLGLPGLQRQRGPAVRADLRPEGGDPRRLEPGGGQRGAPGRLPGRRGRADPARHGQAPASARTAAGRRAAGDRGASTLKLDKQVEAAARRHARADPAALGARPEVRVAHAGQQRRDLQRRARRSRWRSR